MASRRKETCKFEACDNEVKYPILGVCGTCYSGLRLWVGRSVAAKNKRAQQYDRMRERIDYLLNGRGLMPGYRKQQAKEKKS